MQLHVSAKYFSLFNDKKQLMPEILQWDPYKVVEFDSGDQTMRSCLYHTGEAARTLYGMLGLACAATRAPQKRHDNLKNTTYE